jgi:hypothetical protein
LKRDLDLIRAMMLSLESKDELDGQSSLHAPAHELFAGFGKSESVLTYHLLLIIDEGWLLGRYIEVAGEFIIERLTADGHDFIDVTRQPSIWDQAKSAMEAGRSETLRFAWDISKKIAQKEIEKRLGL